MGGAANTVLDTALYIVRAAHMTRLTSHASCSCHPRCRLRLSLTPLPTRRSVMSVRMQHVRVSACEPIRKTRRRKSVATTAADAASMLVVKLLIILKFPFSSTSSPPNDVQGSVSSSVHTVFHVPHPAGHVPHPAGHVPHATGLVTHPTGHVPGKRRLKARSNMITLTSSW